MYRVDVTPVVGLPQFRGWSQVVFENLLSSQLVCAFCVAGDHAGNAGRDLTAQISQAKINSPHELQQFIDQLMAKAQELGVKVQLAAGVFYADKVILGVTGGSVFLKRGDRTGVLLNSVDQVKIVEGKRQAGDIVALITHQASGFINEIKQKFESGFDTDSVVTSVIPGLHGQNDSSLSSIAFVAGGRNFGEAASEIETEPEADSAAVAVIQDQPAAIKAKAKEPTKKTAVAKSINLKDLKNEPQQTVVTAKDPHLSKLGQASTTTPSPVRVKQISKKIIAFLKKINWRSGWVRVVALLSLIKAFLFKAIGLVVVLFRKLTAKDIYLNSSPQRLKRAVMIILLSIVLVGGGIGFVVYKNKQQLASAQLVLDPVIAELKTAQSQIEANPIQARETVSQSIEQLEQLEKDFSDQKKAQQLVTTELNSARDLYEQISGLEEFGQLEIFYDLRLIDNDFVVSAVDATDKNAVFLDKEKKQAISLTLDTKQTQLLDLDKITQPLDLELNDTQLTILGQGIWQKDLAEADSGFDEIIAEGDSNREANLVEGFATYIYLLNPSKRNVYRYAQQEKGYSDPIGWVSGAAGFDYGQVSSWAIDGEMWVATRDGGLYKLASGQEQDFNLTGLAEPFTHSLQVFTHEDLENLYVLEPDGKRLVVFNKEGGFLKEIKSNSLVSTTTLFVSEKLGKAFAVSGSIVYAMSI